MTDQPPTLLCILDGLGLNPNANGNAVALAKKPNLDRLLHNSPNNTLCTHGLRVGLPEGQMGNSEVGHLNIGAGRVVEQWLVRISRELEEGIVRDSPQYQNFISSIPATGALHLVGLYSEGGVHSHSDHLFTLLAQVQKDFSGQIVLHVITDGRDTAPAQAIEHIKLLAELQPRLPRIEFGTISGRFYAMDRDTRWDRTKQAFDAIACGEGTRIDDLRRYISECYARGVTDEFIEPAVIGGYASRGIRPYDGVLFWNFRADRMRQIVRSLCLNTFDQFKRGAFEPPTAALCFCEYAQSFGVPFIFSPMEINNHLGQVISQAGLPQLRTAETEKYPHVTYFFNGGAEAPVPLEQRTLIPSPRDVKTYDLKPEMSAHEVCEVVTAALQEGKHRLIVVNFANCDMVGHTGVIEAAVRAVETVDLCLGKILSALDAVGGQAVIIADHGNAEQMIDYETGEPHTAHTTHPVPIIVYGRKDVGAVAAGGALCDVAPTVLALMGIPQPKEMTGKSLAIPS